MIHIHEEDGKLETKILGDIPSITGSLILALNQIAGQIGEEDPNAKDLFITVFKAALEKIVACESNKTLEQISRDLNAAFDIVAGPPRLKPWQRGLVCGLTVAATMTASGVDALSIRGAVIFAAVLFNNLILIGR